MNKGLRTALWVLSSLAVVWVALALICVVAMGATRMGTMMGPGGMSGMMDGTMSGVLMMGMMLCMALTWIVMLGLVGLFIYLLVTTLRERRIVAP